MRVTPVFSPSLLPHMKRRAPALAAALCLALAASGCATRSAAPAATDSAAKPAAGAGAHTTTVTQLQKFMWFFSPYRPDIQQGNFVSQDMLDQLKEGMTRDQVRFVLGTPMLADIFHAERWDYPFRLAKGNGEITTATVVVYFKDDKVARWEGGNLPSEREYIERIAGPVLKFKKAEEKAASTSAAPGKAPLPAGSETSK